MTRSGISAFLTTLSLLLPGAVAASSPDAWEAFRKAVDEACSALVDLPEGTETITEVAPFGTESHGVALITVSGAEAGPVRMICIYDKQARTAELSDPLPQ